MRVNLIVYTLCRCVPLCNASYSHYSYYAIEWKSANEDFDSIAYSLNTVKERYV